MELVEFFDDIVPLHGQLLRKSRKNRHFWLIFVKKIVFRPSSFKHKILEDEEYTLAQKKGEDKDEE